MCITKLSDMFCMSSSYTRTTSRRYRQCSHKILCHESTSAGGSCTFVWKSPTSHGTFSLMKTSSPGKLFAIHTTVMWADENPHTARSHGFLERYSLKIWEGFLDGCVTGPYLLSPNLTVATYLRFLEGILHGCLEDVPLHGHQNMWFQHNGTPPHFSLAV